MLLPRMSYKEDVVKKELKSVLRKNEFHLDTGRMNQHLLEETRFRGDIEARPPLRGRWIGYSLSRHVNGDEKEGVKVAYPLSRLMLPFGSTAER